jgi:hypothetical protein
VLTDSHATTEDLKQAIASAESLIDEAKRELAAKQLRDRRAAFEQLYAAMEKADEKLLEEALITARRVEMPEEDVAKAEAKLLELRERTDEQREAIRAKERETASKKQAFLLIKRDDKESLQTLLQELPCERWREWRDLNGRTLLKYAMEIRASQVLQLLQPSEPVKEKPRTAASELIRLSSKMGSSAAAQPAAVAETPRDEPAVEKTPEPTSGSQDTSKSDCVNPEQYEKFKAQALRSVVQDKISDLAEVFQAVPVAVWSQWTNKAGKDLLTLSQERGASGAYGMIAKALGILREQKRDSYEEREAVWVFLPGDVQPRRATVLEDTPEDAEEVYLEYWDGEDPPLRIERCMVRKMWS